MPWAALGFLGFFDFVAVIPEIDRDTEKKCLVECAAKCDTASVDMLCFSNGLIMLVVKKDV